MTRQDREKQRILVTGASGFLGHHLVTRLLEEGYQVRVLVRNGSQRTFPWGQAVEMVEGDVLDPLILQEALQQIDWVIHTAARVSFWKQEAREVMAVNVTGTANVVDACLVAGCRMIQISSIAALGTATGENMVTETTEWGPGQSRSVYSESKRKAELEVFRGIAEGLYAIFINPSIILGPTHDWQQGTGKMFSIVNRGLRVVNPGASGFVGVKDVAAATVFLMDQKVASGEHFLLSAENLSFQEVFSMIADQLNKAAPAWILPRWPTMLVAFLSEWWSWLSGNAPIVTRESMRSGFLSRTFDGSRIGGLGFEYTPIQDVIREAATQFREDVQQGRSN